MTELTLIERVKNDIEIRQAIKEAAYETPHLSWGASDIFDIVLDQLGIELDTSDSAVIESLITYFDEAQQQAFIHIVQQDKRLRGYMIDIACEMGTINNAVPVYDADSVRSMLNKHYYIALPPNHELINQLLPWCNTQFAQLAKPFLKTE